MVSVFPAQMVQAGFGQMPPADGDDDMPCLSDRQDQARERTRAAARTVPLEAHCSTCGHVWPVAYMPMPVAQLAELAGAARCPKGCTAGPDVKMTAPVLVPPGGGADWEETVRV